MWLLSKREYYHTGIKSIHVVASIIYGYWNTVKIIVILVRFQKFPLSKHVTFLHFRNSFLLGMYKHAYKYHLYYKCIYHQNGKKCYKLIVFGHELTYFILSSTKKEKNRYTQIWVTTNLEFRIDDIFAELGGHVCQQLVLYINTTYGLSQGLYLSLYDEWH